MMRLVKHPVTYPVLPDITLTESERKYCLEIHLPPRHSVFKYRWVALDKTYKTYEQDVYFEIAEKCLLLKPKKRPTMNYILNFLGDCHKDKSVVEDGRAELKALVREIVFNKTAI